MLRGLHARSGGHRLFGVGHPHRRAPAVGGDLTVGRAASPAPDQVQASADRRSHRGQGIDPLEQGAHHALV